MPKIARGCGTGASSVTPATSCAGPAAGVRSPDARRSRTVPCVNSTTWSPRTSPATGSVMPSGRKVASFIATRLDGLPILSGFVSGDNPAMDTSAISAAASASSATYRSFADATRAVLDLLERHMPEATLFLAHLDRGQFIHRIVDTRKGGEFGLRSNLATPLGDAFCSHMAEDRAPRLCDEIAKQPVYRALPMQQRMDAASYLGVPLELSDGTRVGSLAALSREYCAFEPADEQLFVMLARVLASELERESNERDLRRFNDMLRDQARGMAAVGRVARALASSDDARRQVCEAACEVAGAPVAFLLEPIGREFTSTAMAGAEIAPVTIQPRGDAAGSGRAFTSKETYFVADARTHPALAAPLVEATGARSAVFEPVLRDGVVAGVLIVIWRVPLEALPDAPGGVLRLLAAQAAVAIEYGTLRDRLPGVSFSTPLHRAPPRARPEGGRGGPAGPRATPPLGVPADHRRARRRPHERVQHAARRE